MSGQISLAQCALELMLALPSVACLKILRHYSGFVPNLPAIYINY